MKKILFIALLVFLAKPTTAQTKTTVKGCIMGQAMEELEGVTIFNKHSLDAAKSNNRGFFSIAASLGDTLVFAYPKYSKDQQIIKRYKDNVNVIMINRKTAVLPPNHTDTEYIEAARDDNKLYKILDKGAERNGLWNY